MKGGLGLANCKKKIEMHGREKSVKSEEEKEVYLLSRFLRGGKIEEY
jgi:signal transduction histidine kinase